MIIITISEEKLRNSKYYDGIKCWDYPIEEIDYLIELEHEENNEVKYMPWLKIRDYMN